MAGTREKDEWEILTAASSSPATTSSPTAIAALHDGDKDVGVNLETPSSLEANVVVDGEQIPTTMQATTPSLSTKCDVTAIPTQDSDTTAPAVSDLGLSAPPRPDRAKDWSKESGICWRCHLLDLSCTPFKASSQPPHPSQPIHPSDPAHPSPPRYPCRKCRLQPDGPGYLRCRTDNIADEVTGQVGCLEGVSLGTGNWVLKGVEGWHYRVCVTYRVEDRRCVVRDWKVSAFVFLSLVTMFASFVLLSDACISSMFATSRAS